MFVEEKTQGEPQPVKVGTLKLSQAMRIGAAKTAQCTFGLYAHKGATCAWGAAAVGFGASPGNDNQIEMKAGSLHSGNAGGEAFKEAHGFSIMNANDHRGWPRERIAGWLESQGY